MTIAALGVTVVMAVAVHGETVDDVNEGRLAIATSSGVVLSTPEKAAKTPMQDMLASVVMVNAYEAGSDAPATL